VEEEAVVEEEVVAEKVEEVVEAKEGVVKEKAVVEDKEEVEEKEMKEVESNQKLSKSKNTGQLANAIGAKLVKANLGYMVCLKKILEKAGIKKVPGSIDFTSQEIEIVEKFITKNLNPI